MPVPNVFGGGVGLTDRSLLDANFATITSGGGFSTLNNITARAGGTQVAGAPVLSAAINSIAVCATNADSVLLPSAVGGQAITVINAGAANASVFSSLSSTADTINGTAGTTAFNLVTGKTAEFISPAAGVWKVILSA
jgi:hypothetical protein